MDEADIDGEDFNELEARLYGQIHHESVEEGTAEVINVEATRRSDNNGQKEVVERIVTAKSVVNRSNKSSRVPDTRYWARGLKTTTFNKANQNDDIGNNEPTANELAENQGVARNTVYSKQGAEHQTSNDGGVGLEEDEAIEPGGISLSQMLLNPAALANRKKTKFNKKKKLSKPVQWEHSERTGPFMQQKNKLQKALLVRAKKQKSKKVRDKNRKGVLRVNDTIVLESSTEDDNSNSSAAEYNVDDDVVLVPTKPPPLITLTDSENEQDNAEASSLQLEEENAMDASDVVISKQVKSNNFTKPTDKRCNITTNNSTEKRTEQVSSRCTSPNSVLSSDDFIGQSDRCRLLADTCMADDQDLALLTADVDSLIQPQSEGLPKMINSAITTASAATIPTDDVICTAEFTAPIATLNATTVTNNASAVEKRKKQQNEYRVEKSDFRAVDVYESESDINDSVYSKGGSGRATTIINAAGSSSDADDVQQKPKSQRVKRLTKYRALTTKQYNASTDDEGMVGDDGVPKTSVPYIMRGTAVEHCNKNIRKRTQSLSNRRASSGGVGNVKGTLTDTEFIATLNNLVQGNTVTAVDNEQDEEENENGNKVSESADNVEEIADFSNEEGKEKETKSSTFDHQPLEYEPDREDMKSVQIIEHPTHAGSLSEAVPDEAIQGLDKIFESIDNLAEKVIIKKSTNYDNESSGEELEVVQPPSATNEAGAKENKNNSHIRNVVYSERSSQFGGIGWNSEMIKFYNCSWHGEHFSVVGVQNGLEKDRNLWKIHSEDRFPKKKPYSNLKCYNCCEFGHTRAKCTRPKKPLICYMCGESGHLEPRCPNTMCLRCGNKTQVFTRSCNACTFQNMLICPICKVRGHAINLCPDKWRRYHSTTQPNTHLNSHIEFNRRKVCCICGNVGHFSDTCRSPARFMDYPIIVTHVKSHQKSYNDMLFKTPWIGIAFNLLYRPGETITFHMAEKTEPNGYYERFLRAVELGNLINRKRAHVLSLEESSATPAKKGRNIGGRRAVEKTRDQLPVSGLQREEQDTAPEQVQEVSGSLTTEELSTSDGYFVNNGENEVNETNEKVMREGHSTSTNGFKTPNEVSATTNTRASAMQNKDNLPVDSDSNYSFSDHFEMPDIATADENNVNMDDHPLISSADAATADENDVNMDDQPSTSSAAAAAAALRSPNKVMKISTPARNVGPLPDFIPLSNNTNINDANKTNEHFDNFDMPTGISRCFVADVTDDENEDRSRNFDTKAPENMACEAKIYLTHLHSNYLLSPDGHDFLINKSKESNIRARLDLTSVGHVLVIFGLPKQQDIFHKALLEKCHEIMDEMNNRQLNVIKVPKRIDALIRFLRDNISQLQSNLGEVNDLHRCIQNSERIQSKTNIKLGEKYRRLLNMILLGQAGLGGGDKHLNNLLMNLKSLISDNQPGNNVPPLLREEIDSHSKMIFTSYRHKNYPELIQTYNRLPKGQRTNNLNIDPLLLGQRILDTTLTAEQRVRIEQPQSVTVATAASAATANNSNTAPQPRIGNQATPYKSNLFNKLNRTPQTQVPETFITNIKNKVNKTMPNKRQNYTAQPPFINPQQKSTFLTKLQENTQQNQQYGNILARNTSDTGRSYSYQNRHENQLIGDIHNFNADMQTPSKGPSIFWSRESMRYLDECIQLAESNTELVQKLQRIQSKSIEGALSYNDYRAVIKLHGAMVGN